MQEQHGLATVAQVVLRAAMAALGIAFAYQVQDPILLYCCDQTSQLTCNEELRA